MGRPRIHGQDVRQFSFLVSQSLYFWVIQQAAKEGKKMGEWLRDKMEEERQKHERD